MIFTNMAYFCEVGLNLKRVLLLVCFALISAELNSNFLFLWPLNHSCAPKPVNLSGSIYDVDWTDAGGRHYNATSPNELLQTVFDRPYLHDLDTLARAYVMGIKQDDIARCYMNKVEENKVTNATSGENRSVTTVEMGNLVACQYGVRIETHRQPLSVIGYFQLVCSRSDLKVLLPLSLGFGILSGVLLIYWLWSWDTEKSRKRAQVVLVLPYHDQDSKSWWHNIWLLLIFIALITLTLTYLSYKLSNPDEEDIEALKRGSSMSSGFPHLITCVFLRALVVASCLSRILIQWQLKLPMDGDNKQLVENRTYYSMFVITTVAFHAIYYPLTIRLMRDWSSLNNTLTCTSIALLATVLMLEFYLICKKKTPSYSDANAEPLSKVMGSAREPELDQAASKTMKVCEFCMMQAPVGCEENYEAYRSTTEIIQHQSQKGTSHNLGSLHRNLLGLKVLTQIWLLVFCCALNYFMLIMIPNHQLLHSETMEAILEHKSHNSRIVMIDAKPANSTNPRQETTDDSIVDSGDNYFPVSTANVLTGNMNPLIIMWVTNRLTDWLIELVVILIHLKCLSSPAKPTSYSKLKRLFNLVKLGALVLAIQWISVAIFRGQNHLIEYSWPRTLNFCVSKVVSTLMVHEYITVLLKLSQRASTNMVAGFVPVAASATAAFIVSALAPMMEKCDLVIIPVTLICNNYLAYILAKRLTTKFKQSLCPMMLDE